VGALQYSSPISSKDYTQDEYKTCVKYHAML
jgi:hypothetical protein